VLSLRPNNHSWGGERERDETSRVEAGAFGEQIRQRANEQRRTSDEDQGKGDLERDNALPEANSAEGRAGALAQREDQGVAAGVKRRCDTAEEAGPKARKEREGEQSEADLGAERGAVGIVAGQESDQPS
jgi:hypothetical protein